VSTPEAAVNAGSDYLVVGRPITQAEDPVHTAQRYLDAIEKRP
jgi:orotidine-5'-phosphate decarboxylase